MKNYTNKDKECPHCGGKIEGHCGGEKAIYWCDKCGSNNKERPPNIKIERKI